MQETVSISQYHDLNANGLVDAGEPLVLQFQVTDGQVPMIGITRDPDRPGDEDGVVNGAIRVELYTAALPDICHVAAHYVLVCATSSGSAPLQAVFTILPAAQEQALTGTVTSSGVPVAHAFVLLLDSGWNQDEFVSGTVSGADGSYRIPAAPGQYSVIAYKPGFVFSLDSSELTWVASVAGATQEIALLTGTTPISGRVYDAVNQFGLGGMHLTFRSFDGLAGMAITEASGEYSAMLQPSFWLVQLAEPSLSLSGYSGEENLADNTLGAVANLDLPLTRSRGNLNLVFEYPAGTFNDGTNGSTAFPVRVAYYRLLYQVSDLDPATSITFTGPEGSGLTNSSAPMHAWDPVWNTSLYQCSAQELPPDPPEGIYTVSYEGQPQSFLLEPPVTEQEQVMLRPRVTVDAAGLLQQVEWSSFDPLGQPVTPPDFMLEITLRIDALETRLYETALSPLETTHVIPQPLVRSDITVLHLAYRDVSGHQFVRSWYRLAQPLQVLGTRLPALSTWVEGYYPFQAQGGQPPYRWSLSAGTLPGGLSLNEAGELTGVPTAGAFSFTVRVTDAQSRVATQNFSGTVEVGQLPAELQMLGGSPPGVRIIASPGIIYTLESSTDLQGWVSLVTTTMPASTLEWRDTRPVAAARFYRVRTGP